MFTKNEGLSYKDGQNLWLDMELRYNGKSYDKNQIYSFCFENYSTFSQSLSRRGESAVSPLFAAFRIRPFRLSNKTKKAPTLRWYLSCLVGAQNRSSYKFWPMCSNPCRLFIIRRQSRHRNYSLFISVSDFIIHYENPF